MGAHLDQFSAILFEPSGGQVDKVAHLMGHPPDAPVRWWPATFIVLAAALALFGMWTPDTPQRELVVILSLTCLALTVPLLLLWAIVLSRLPKRQHNRVAVGILLVALALSAVIRYRGLSGDFVPSLAWRWTEEPLSAVANREPTSDRGPVSDYPQFLGPQRNAQLPNLALSDWSTRPPRLIWRQPIGQGWSSFAIVGTHAVTQEQRGELECVVSYDLLTGRERWVHTETVRYVSTVAGNGPRATPTVHEGRVFTYGALGHLNCLDLETGREIWSRNPLSENGVEPTFWGNSCSPLIHDGAVIVSIGGQQDNALGAYETETGEVRWRGGNGRAGYGSPTTVELTGQVQILIFNEGHLASHDPEGGQRLWTQPWPEGVEHTTQPIALPGDRVFLSSGYGIGSKLFQVDRSEQGLVASIVWETPHLKMKFTNAVVHEGSIYGLDNGVLVCLDPETGQRRWKRGRYGHGQILLIGNHILVQTESGELALVAADPSGFRELARHPALEGKTWNNPAFAPPYLLVRNDREAICFEMGLVRPASMEPGGSDSSSEDHL